ncbi:MAG TPA: hypothetical protein VNO32_24765, partial [Candidatus Acidoferrum sp.]|nr:hypothetical protein [Candidatus Acidoferrum sp.]
INYMFENSAIKEDLLPRLRDAALHPPAPFKQAAEHEQYMEEQRIKFAFICARCDVDKFKYVPGPNPSKVEVERPMPETLRSIQFATQEQMRSFEKSTQLLMWGQIQFDGKKADIDAQTAYGESLMLERIVIPDSRHKSFLEEHRIQALTSVAAALVVFHDHWLSQHVEALRWCRERLLSAPPLRPLVPGTDDDYDASIYQMGADRYAARSLPFLLALDPSNEAVDRKIIELVLSNSTEVHAFLFAAMAVFRKSIPGFVNRMVALALWRGIKHLELNRWVPRLERPRGDFRKWREEEIEKACQDQNYPQLPDLKNLSVRDIDYHDGRGVLLALSCAEDMPLDQKRWSWDVLELLLRSTCAEYEAPADEHSRRSDVAELTEWTDSLCASLAPYFFDASISERTHGVLDFLLERWTRAISLMAGVLRRIEFVGSSHGLEERLLNLHAEIAGHILENERYNEQHRWLGQEEETLLGLLIFIDPAGYTKWEIDEWPSLVKAVPVIDRWVERVGTTPGCFRSLLRLIKGIGSKLFMQHGLRWISSVVRETAWQEELFKHGARGSLAELLSEEWIRHYRDLLKNAHSLAEFTYLVEVLVAAGDELAMRLLTRIENRVR